MKLKWGYYTDKIFRYGTLLRKCEPQIILFHLKDAVNLEVAMGKVI